MGAALLYTYQKLFAGLIISYTVTAILVLFTVGFRVGGQDYTSELMITSMVLLNLLTAYVLSYYGCLHAFHVEQRTTLIVQQVAETGQSEKRSVPPTVRMDGIPTGIESPLSGEDKQQYRSWSVPEVPESMPLVWKQLYFPNRIPLLSLSWLLSTAIGLVVLLSLAYTLTPQDNYRSGTMHFWILRGTLVLYLSQILLRACTVFPEEQSQQTLLTLLTIPQCHQSLLLEVAWGTIWRYRGLAIACLFAWHEAIFFGSVACLLIAGTVVSQLVFLAMLALALSLLFKNAIRAIMALVACLGATTLLGLSWPNSTGNWLLFVPFQTFPHPFVRLDGATQLLALCGYWGCLWLGAYFLLDFCARRLYLVAAES